MKQKSVGMTLRVLIIALALSLVAGSPALPPFDGVAYAQSTTGLTATLTPANAVSLTWNAVDGADSYEVWRGDGKGSTVQWGSSAHATVTAPAVTYTDSAVMAGNTYSYAVRAVTGGTPASFMGPYPNVEIPGGVAKPTERPTVTVTADGTTAVDVSWTSVATATSYEIEFWHSGLDDWDDSIPAQTSMSYKHTGLTPGTEYYYVVRGVNAGGMGDWSSWRTDDSKVTLQGTSATPTLDLDHTSRTVVELSWTPAPAGSKYNLHRRKVTTDSADPPVSNPADDTGWSRLPSGLLTTTSYTDSAANHVPDTTGLAATGPYTVMYEYRVQAIDSDDVAGNWSNVKKVSIPSAGAVVGMPTGLTARAVSSSSTRVTWTAVAGASFYELQWKSGDGNYNTPFRVDSSPYEHGNLSPSTKYTYQVRAVDINGVGDWSSEASVTTHSVTAAAGQMPQVTGLTVTDATMASDGADRKAKLTWTAVSGATHYEIQRYNPGATDPAWAAPTAAGTPALDTGRLTMALATASPTWTDSITTAAAEGAGQTYYYVVSAVNEGVDETVGNADDEMGAWSAYKSVTFVDLKPLPPVNVGETGAPTAEKTNGNSVLFDWMQPNFDRTATPANGMATSWTVQWRHAGTNAWTNQGVTGSSSFHHTGLRSNTTYYYRVRAENAGGMSTYTDPVSVVLGNALNAPTGVRAVDATTATGAAIKVSWNAVAGADSYEIQRFGDDNTWGDLADTTELSVTVTGTEVTDDGDNDTTTNTGTALSASTTYLYRVRMVKETVPSGWSAVVSGTTRATEDTTAPTLRAITTGQSMIRLSWEAVMGATGYRLQYLEGAQDADVFNNPNTNARTIPIGGNFRHYVHTGLKAGTQYSYRLQAVLASGAEATWSDPEASGAETQPWTKPAPPDVTATADGTTITLTWKPTTSTAGAYRVEWRLAGSGNDWAVVTGSETVAGSACTATTCTWTHSSLTAATHYQYRVRAEADATTAGGHKSYWDYANQRTPAASN